MATGSYLNKSVAKLGKIHFAWHPQNPQDKNTAKWLSVVIFCG
jgi:hypothetical protein